MTVKPANRKTLKGSICDADSNCLESISNSECNSYACQYLFGFSANK